MPFSKKPSRNASSPARLVAVGYCSKAHGIRGELVLVLQAESADILHRGIYVRPRQGGDARFLEVKSWRRHHGTLLVSLEGVNTRNDAELLRAHSVFVLEENLPPLGEDEIYLRDLPGLRVWASSPGGEEELGVITEVSCPAGQDLWTILTPDGAEILFPAVEEFVLAIEPEKGRALIAPPPGLLDIYLAPGKK